MTLILTSRSFQQRAASETNMSNMNPPVKGEVTPDALQLPEGFSGLKHNPAQPKSNPPGVANGHIETIIRVIHRGEFNQLRISRVIAPNDRAYASLRVFHSQDGETWSPTKNGVMVALRDVPVVIDALQAVKP